MRLLSRLTGVRGTHSLCAIVTRREEAETLTSRDFHATASGAFDYGSAVRAEISEAQQSPAGRMRLFFHLLFWAHDVCAGRCEVVGPTLEYWHREFRDRTHGRRSWQSWSPEDDRMLADLYGVRHLPLDQVAQRLGRTPNATKLRASDLGIRRTYVPDHLRPRITPAHHG